MWLLLLTVAAAREFPIARCESLAAGIATPAKAIEESCKADLGLTGGQCEFFSEAHGLAITHAGYTSKTFCNSVGGAVKCSQLMDEVLTSGPVSDLAFAACIREQGAKSLAYCQSFQTTLAVADRSTDLDTLRACYLLEEEAKTVAAPIVQQGLGGSPNGTTAGGSGSATPPETVVNNTSPSRPFGVTTNEGTVPTEPQKVTVEPMHGVRRNGSAYEEHHILQGDGPLSNAGVGTPAAVDLPAVPPKTREELAVAAGTEAGKLAGGTAGGAAGEAVGAEAGHAAGEAAGLAIAANETIPRSSVEAAAYKAGFDAGQTAGAAVDIASLIKIHAVKAKPALLAKPVAVVSKAALVTVASPSPAKAAAVTPATAEVSKVEVAKVEVAKAEVAKVEVAKVEAVKTAAVEEEDSGESKEAASAAKEAAAAAKEAAAAAKEAAAAAKEAETAQKKARAKKAAKAAEKAELVKTAAVVTAPEKTEAVKTAAVVTASEKTETGATKKEDTAKDVVVKKVKEEAEAVKKVAVKKAGEKKTTVKTETEKKVSAKKEADEKDEAAKSLPMSGFLTKFVNLD